MVFNPLDDQMGTSSVRGFYNLHLCIHFMSWHLVYRPLINFSKIMWSSMGRMAHISLNLWNLSWRNRNGVLLRNLAGMYTDNHLLYNKWLRHQYRSPLHSSSNSHTKKYQHSAMQSHVMRHWRDIGKSTRYHTQRLMTLLRRDLKRWLSTRIAWI